MKYSRPGGHYSNFYIIYIFELINAFYLFGNVRNYYLLIYFEPHTHTHKHKNFKSRSHLIRANNERNQNNYLKREEEHGEGRERNGDNTYGIETARCRVKMEQNI